jgi:hypothetical protein
MPLGSVFKKLRRGDISEEFKEIEESAYQSKLYNSLSQLKDIVKGLKSEIERRGYCTPEAQSKYIEDMKKVIKIASNYAYKLGDEKLEDKLLSFYITLKKLPPLQHDIKTVKKIDEAVDEILKHYEKRHKEKEEKSGSEIPGIFVVLLLSFLLFLFVSFSSSSSGYFVKSSDLISISLIFSFLLAFSVLLLLKNL